MKPQGLQTKREYDCYIQALKDIKKTIDADFKRQIDYFENMKKFCDKE